MAKERSVYIGPRIRRLRRSLGLTQASMAAELDVSPSYVALMERNQRPVTAELLLRLAETYQIDLRGLAASDENEQGARLAGILKDPILMDLDLSSVEIDDIANGHPGMTEAFIRLYTAYSEGQIALADKSGMTGTSGDTPLDKARNFLAARQNYFPVLDERAEKLAHTVNENGGIEHYLAETHGYKVRRFPPDIMNGAVRRFQLHKLEIHISDTLDAASDAFQLALQLAYLELGTSIEAILNETSFDDEASKRLTKRSLANYAAGAILMPYTAFFKAAEERQYDIEALCRQFRTSFEQVGHRLTTLQRSNQTGVPFFFIRIDQAGNVSKRFDSGTVPFARHGGSCPVWSVHKCFQRPGEIFTEWAELPEGEKFFSISRTVVAGGGSYQTPKFTRAIALGCTEEHASRLIYSKSTNSLPKEPTPIGVSCRLCHRPDCAARAEPPLGRTLLPDDYHRMMAPFGFSDS